MYLGDPLCDGKGVELDSKIQRDWIVWFTLLLTLSKEAGLINEKQTMKTSVWGYERGRNLS